MKKLIIISIVFLLACSEEEGKENFALKSKLQGTWRLEWHRDNNYRILEFSIEQSVIHWKDSIINYRRPDDKMNGELLYTRGTNNIYFRYNDGSTPLTPSRSIRHSFLQRDTNVVLWVEPTPYTHKVYTLKDGKFTLRSETEISAKPHVCSSTLTFSNNDQTVELCEYPLESAFVHCYVVNKISD